jgi:hypothetical protein
VQEYWSDKLTHAFCLEAHQCKHVAELVYASITSSMPHLAAQMTAAQALESKLAAAAAQAAAGAPANDVQQQQPDQAEGAAVDMNIFVSDEATVGQAVKEKVAC